MIPVAKSSLSTVKHRWLTVKELTEFMPISTSEAYRQLETGVFGSVQFSEGIIRIPTSMLVTLDAELRGYPTPEVRRPVGSPTFLRMPQVCRELRVHSATMRRIMDSGNLPIVRYGTARVLGAQVLEDLEREAVQTRTKVDVVEFLAVRRLEAQEVAA